jgi:hypothetical protein
MLAWFPYGEEDAASQSGVSSHSGRYVGEDVSVEIFCYSYLELYPHSITQ